MRQALGVGRGQQARPLRPSWSLVSYLGPGPCGDGDKMKSGQNRQRTKNCSAAQKRADVSLAKRRLRGTPSPSLHFRGAVLGPRQEAGPAGPQREEPRSAGPLLGTQASAQDEEEEPPFRLPHPEIHRAPGEGSECLITRAVQRKVGQVCGRDGTLWEGRRQKKTLDCI